MAPIAPVRIVFATQHLNNFSGIKDYRPFMIPLDRILQATSIGSIRRSIRARNCSRRQPAPVFFQLGVVDIRVSRQVVVPKGSSPQCLNGKFSLFEQRVEYRVLQTQALATHSNTWIANHAGQKDLPDSLSIEIGSTRP